MKQVRAFESVDGQTFLSRYQCASHEFRLRVQRLIPFQEGSVSREAHEEDVEELARHLLKNPAAFIDAFNQFLKDIQDDVQDERADGPTA